MELPLLLLLPPLPLTPGLPNVLLGGLIQSSKTQNVSVFQSTIQLTIPLALNCNITSPPLIIRILKKDGEISTFPTPFVLNKKLIEIV